MERALALFSERGTTAVSMRELADAAGVTVPGLYYHFASKAELIREVYRARGFDTPIEDFVAPVASPVRARIVEQAQAEFARLVADSDFLRLMQRESVLGDEDAREVGTVLAEQWRARWELVLAGATDLSPRADLSVAADGIATFLWGLFVDYLNKQDETVIGRIEGFAALVTPALTTSPS
jgi:TetR/AcrR family transcriptional regulator, repressor for uid operon